MLNEESYVNLEVLKEHLDFYKLVTFFEEKKVKVRYNSISFCCPFHKENTPSFHYGLENKTYFCFSCSIRGDCFDYVKHKLSCNFREAIEFVLKFTGLEPEFIKKGEKVSIPDFIKDLKALSKNGQKEANVFSSVSEEDIRQMKLLRGDFFLDRGLTKETLDFFEVGFDPKEERVVVPIRDENSILVGITGRTIHKDFKVREIAKWKHYKNSSINKVFFNINNGINYSKDKNHSIILCEGPSDVMYLHQNGYRNAVACLSNNIGNIQKGILLRNFINVYLFLDGDKGGDSGKSAIYDAISGYFTIYNVQAIRGKDPDEMTKEELDFAFQNVRKI